MSSAIKEFFSPEIIAATVLFVIALIIFIFRTYIPDANFRKSMAQCKDEADKKKCTIGNVLNILFILLVIISICLVVYSIIKDMRSKSPQPAGSAESADLSSSLVAKLEADGVTARFNSDSSVKRLFQ